MKRRNWDLSFCRIRCDTLLGETYDDTEDFVAAGRRKIGKTKGGKLLRENDAQNQMITKTINHYKYLLLLIIANFYHSSSFAPVTANLYFCTNWKNTKPQRPSKRR